MSVRRGVATFAFAWLLCTPAIARAQWAFTATPSVTASGGYAASALIPNNPNANPCLLQNLNAAPAGSAAESGCVVRAAPFASFAGALGLLYETPRSDYSLLSSATLTLPITSAATAAQLPPLFSARSTFLGHIALNDRTGLSLTGSLSALPNNPLVNAVDASSTAVDTSGLTEGYNLSTNVLEVLTREISERDRLVETANVTYNFPYNPDTNNGFKATTLNLRGSLAWSREWLNDNGSLALNVAYTYFGASQTANATDTTAPNSVLNNSLVATWSRELAPGLSSGVDLGILQSVAVDAGGISIYTPTGGARLSYAFDPATASLSYTHGAMVNIFTSSVNLNDQITLRGALPLADSGLSLTGSTGYSRSTPLSTNLSFGTPSNILLADLELAYVPPKYPRLIASLRGTFNRQIAESTTATDNSFVAGFTRFAVNINLAFTFPDARAATISRRLAPAYVPTPLLGSDNTPAPGVQPKPIELELPEPGADKAQAPPAEAAPFKRGP
jgi:hypothetical protein